MQNAQLPGSPGKARLSRMFGEPDQPEEAGGKHPKAYYAHDERRPARDAASLSDHCTALASDRSSNEYDDSRSDYSEDEDNFAIAISAAPCKRAKREVPPKRSLPS